MYDWSIIGDKIFGILKGSGFHLKMFDKEGLETIDPHDATRFYATTQSQDPDLKQFSIMISIHDENARSHIDLKTPVLRNNDDFDFVMKIKDSLDSSVGDREGIKINWYKFDRVIKPRDDVINNISESKDIGRVAGTTRSSYQRVGNGRIILRHTDSIDETKQGSRWRKIKSIFVENHLGERFLYPHIHPSGARAMVRHFTNSGNMHDAIGQSIQNLSSDYISLKNCYRLLNAADQHSLAQSIRESMKSVNKKVKRLSGPRGYSMLSSDLEKPVLTDSVNLDLLHQSLMEKCACTDTESPQAHYLLVAARYLREAEVEIDDGIRFLSRPDLTSRANTFDDQKLRLSWQISQLADCIAAGDTRDRLQAISADLEDGRTIEPDEIDLVRRVFIACNSDSEVPFEPSDPELDRVRQLSGV
jgi:hypothetical protein